MKALVGEGERRLDPLDLHLVLLALALLPAAYLLDVGWFLAVNYPLPDVVGTRQWVYSVAHLLAAVTVATVPAYLALRREDPVRAAVYGGTAFCLSFLLLWFYPVLFAGDLA